MAKATASRLASAGLRALVVVGGFGALLFAGKLGWEWLHTSPRFSIQRVSFVGLSRAQEADLLRLAALGSGQNLFALDVDQVEKAMAAHPWVKALSISRRVPNALVVEVTEHAPAALLALGELYLVNEDGRSFRRVQPGDSLDLPLVTGVDREAYVAETGEAAAEVAEAIRIARAYEASEAGAQVPVSEARLEGGAVVLITERGEQLRLGEGGLEEKFQRLARLRRELSARSLRAEIFHLDNRERPDWVAVKLLQ